MFATQAQNCYNSRMSRESNNPERFKPTPELAPVSLAPEIQSPLEYVQDLARSAMYSRDRVFVQCMDFEMGHAPGIVQNALKVAASHGVDTRLTFDQFAVSFVNNRVGWVPKRGQAKIEQGVTEQADKEMLRTLVDSGVDITITNPTMGIFFPASMIPASPFPFVGRNHMKVTVVDNAAWFGGVNVASDHFEKADFMVKIKNPRVVNALASLFEQVNDNRPKEDYKKAINKDYALLVDRGYPGSSIIYQEAVDMVYTAESSIQYISQLPPSSKLLGEMIDRARDGVDIEIVTQAREHLESNSIPFGRVSKWAFREFLKSTAGFANIHTYHFDKNHGKVHAKMLIVDGKQALWGSHNLARSGVLAGTQEASILTRDQGLVKNLIGWFDLVKEGRYDTGFQKGPFNPQG